MYRYFQTALVPTLLLAATAVAEPVDLKGPAFAAGEVLMMENAVDSDQANMSMSFQGQVMQGQMEMDMSSKIKLEILESEQGEVTKVRQTIEETRQNMKMNMFGQQENQEMGGELDGLSFVQTKTEEGWKTEVEEGNNLPPGAAQTLEEMQFTDPSMVYPDQPVEIGESWDLTGEELTALMVNSGMPGAEIKGDATYTLMEVKEIDGVRTAVINYSMDIQMGLPIDEQGMSMQMAIDMVGEGTIHRRLDTYSETNDMKGSMVLTMSMVQGGQLMMQMEADMPMNSTIRITRAPAGAEGIEDEIEDEVDEAGDGLEEDINGIGDDLEDVEDEIQDAAE